MLRRAFTRTVGVVLAVAVSVYVLVPEFIRARGEARASRCENNLIQHSGWHPGDWVCLDDDFRVVHVGSCPVCYCLLMAYGWRQQRQDPVTLLDDSPTPLQAMVLANGDAAQRAFDMTDSSGITELALSDQPLDAFIQALFLRVLNRPVTTDERELFAELLGVGYEERVVAGPEAVPARRIYRSPRTWSNHLHPEATLDALQRMDQIGAGESPSARLGADWRQRAEDAVWVLVNLPEFVFVP